ncbi:MAG: MFS transporter [Cohaesibacteraceae bacterium]|nr:MFS transporter [Cohaesibacteraceae bacterium]
MLTWPISLLIASVALVGANSLVLSPLASAVAGDFIAIASADVMLASATYGIGTALSAFLLAPMIDRIGGKQALSIALFGLALSLGLTAIAPTIEMLYLGQALAGICAGIVLPASYGLASQLAPKGRESQTLGLVLTGWTLSLVFGVTLAALLADLIHWRAVFVVLSALALVVSLAFYFTKSSAQPHVKGQASSLITALKVPGIGRALVVCASYMIAFYGLYTFLGAHIQDNLGQSTTATGLTALTYGIGFGVAVLFDKKIDQYGADRVAAPVFFVLALTYIVLAFATNSFVLLLAVCGLWGFMNHLGLNLVIGRLIALDPAQRGAIMGVNSGVTYLCVFAGAVGFKPLYEGYGFAICAVVSALCVIPAILNGIRVHRQLRAA